ncbi:hypothetical protein HOY80DRAFT_507968 [Tuber brumale]|nr:hypothetical protein HOY80DRAFT_507968 [Tuber brumale]
MKRRAVDGRLLVILLPWRGGSADLYWTLDFPGTSARRVLMSDYSCLRFLAVRVAIFPPEMQVSVSSARGTAQ